MVCTALKLSLGTHRGLPLTLWGRRILPMAAAPLTLGSVSSISISWLLGTTPCLPQCYKLDLTWLKTTFIPWVTTCLQISAQNVLPSTPCGYCQSSAMTHGTSHGRLFSPCHMGAGIMCVLRIHTVPPFLKLCVLLVLFHIGTQVPAQSW